MKDKPIMTIEDILHEYICNYCVSNNIEIDCRFRCFGDINKYYIGDNKKISINCVTYNYHAFDIEGVKVFIAQYIDALWNKIKSPNNRVGLYIEDIIITKQGFTIIMGGCLFIDDALRGVTHDKGI